MREGDLLVGAFTNGQIGYHRPFPGAGALSHAHSRALSVRLEQPSRRQHHRAARLQRRAGDPRRSRHHRRLDAAADRRAAGGADDTCHCRVLRTKSPRSGTTAGRPTSHQEHAFAGGLPVEHLVGGARFLQLPAVGEQLVDIDFAVRNEARALRLADGRERPGPDDASPAGAAGRC